MKNWVIGFFILQIGFDLAHSVTAFPIVHYGMFSQSFARPDTLTVFRVSVDGVALRTEDFGVSTWDRVQEPLEAAEKRVTTNDFAVDKQRLGVIYARLKVNLDNTSAFVPWYKGVLGRLLGRPVGVLKVDRARYRWSGGRMVLLQTENWINE
ncbi:MAG TPA: hypothetical protein VGM89_14015 [Puia sp.]|jgi:hypothetical protein